MTTPMGSNAAGLNRTLEVRVRHILDQEKWLATPAAPVVAAAPAAPVAPVAPAVRVVRAPAVRAAMAAMAPPPMRGGGDPPPENTLVGVCAIAAVVVACVCVYQILN